MTKTFAQLVLDAEQNLLTECNEWIPSRVQEEEALQPIVDMLMTMPFEKAKAFVMSTWNVHCRMQRICISMHRAQANR